MRIGIVTDVSEVDRQTEKAARAEANYQKEVVRHLEEALSDGYDVIEYVFDDGIVQKLKDDAVDLVFNLANGRENINDRTELPTLLNGAEIPYTGSNALGHGIADDKALTAAILERNGIAHPKTAVASNPVALASIEVEYPAIVKPNREGSSRGITDASVVKDGEELFKETAKLFAYAEDIVVCEYIDGREITVGVIGNGEDIQVLPAVEVDFSNVGKHAKIFSFDVKHEDLVDYHVPARLSEEERNIVEETAKKVYKLLQLRDYARIDMRIKDGKAYVLEANSLAGLHPEESDLVKAAEAAGMDYDALIQKIVEIAIRREELSDDGKHGDVESIRKMRREENARAREIALEAHKDRLEQRTKEKIDDFQEWTKQKSEDYKRKARDLRDDVLDRENENYRKKESAGFNDAYLDGIRSDGAEKKKPAEGESRDARYEALERRVHALEERLRILENR